MILYQLFIPHIIQYKNIADILPFSRHFVYILHRWKTLRRKNGQRVRIRWRRHFPQSFSKNNTILTTTWSFIRFLHWILNDAEQERIQTSHGAERGEAVSMQNLIHRVHYTRLCQKAKFYPREVLWWFSGCNELQRGWNMLLVMSRTIKQS